MTLGPMSMWKDRQNQKQLHVSLMDHHVAQDSCTHDHFIHQLTCFGRQEETSEGNQQKILLGDISPDFGAEVLIGFLNPYQRESLSQ